MNVLRPDAEDDLLSTVGLNFINEVIRNPDPERTTIDVVLPISLHDGGIEEVHARAADEPGNEQVGRVIVNDLRNINLLQHSILHNGDPGGHRHSLYLIVGHVDECGAKPLVKLGELRSGLNPQFGVQVGKGLIEQEDSRLPNDSTSYSDSLPLTAG